MRDIAHDTHATFANIELQIKLLNHEMPSSIKCNKSLDNLFLSASSDFNLPSSEGRRIQPIDYFYLLSLRQRDSQIPVVAAQVVRSLDVSSVFHDVPARRSTPL